MAIHTAPTSYITPTDLRACESPHDVFVLFGKLRYPVEPEVTLSLDAEELPGALRDGIVARYPVAVVGGTRPGDPRLDVTLFVLQGTEKASPMWLARGIEQLWPRRFPGNHLLVFAVRGGAGVLDQIIFVNAWRLGDGATIRIKLHKLIVERTHPTRHDAETLNCIALPSPQTSADDLYRIQCKAFDVERLTDEFYREYARRCREAMTRIKDDNKGIKEFYDDAKLHTFTQRLFGRMMFLYFLQKKGALNGEQNFITERYRDTVTSDENYYRHILEPLFFQTLNRERDGAASRFGRVPYLNGGLFASEVHHLGTVLHGALAQAERLGLVARNACTLVNTPRIADHEMQVLTPDQVRILLEVARDDRLEALYVLAVTTGMRQGELLALRWGDVDLNRSALSVRATLQHTKADGYHLAALKTKHSQRQIALGALAGAAL